MLLFTFLGQFLITSVEMDERTYNQIKQTVENLMLPGEVRNLLRFDSGFRNTVVSCLLEAKNIGLLLSLLDVDSEDDRRNAVYLLNYLINCVKGMREAVVQKDGIW